MIETAFLLIALNGGTVRVLPELESMFVDPVVPTQVVKECTEYTGISPYNIEQMSNIYNELELMDCFFYDVGAHEHNIYSE